MADELDEILNELQHNRQMRDAETENAAQKAEEERRDKVSSFRLNVNLDDEFGEYTPPLQAEVAPQAKISQQAETPSQVEMPPEPGELQPIEKREPEQPPVADDPQPMSEKPVKKRRRSKKDPQAREVWGCAGSLFYVVLTIGVSLVLACFIIVAGLDMTGVNKSGIEVKVTFEEGVTTAEIADVLKENGLIDQKWAFKLYSKVRGVDGQYKSGVYTLTANMGYGNIMDVLRAGMPRTTVRITIPEGYTVDQIAALMEDNAVCTKKAFYDAVQNGDYSRYSFIASIPAAEGDYAGRGYALEGYLFPDTYDFYTGSSGEAVVEKLLDNFNTRIDTTYKTKIAAKDMTINDVVILASIVQAEASDGEWSKVARVLTNRMEHPADYPYLQCDATVNYYKNLDRTVEGLAIQQDAYDTAVRRGLTPGAVGNPGLHAIDAVLSPSDDKSVAKCYYFATDYSSGITYYSETYSQHVAVCKKYGIG